MFHILAYFNVTDDGCLGFPYCIVLRNGIVTIITGQQMKGNINKLFFLFKSYCKGAIEQGTSPPAAHVEHLSGPQQTV